MLVATHRGFEIVQASVMVIALGHPGFTQIEIECERSLEGLSRFLPESGRWWKIRRVVAARIDV